MERERSRQHGWPTRWRLPLSFEEAAITGDDDDIKAEALYELYRLLRLSDPPRAERRRAELLASFPETEYALILSDPDYVRKHQEMATEGCLEL
ncbi:MAG: hypothetical protein MZV63_48120 [Marinilabiliales bacterium]|nr:hypothetical protein [Marinilabiliales bacterium]